VPDAEKVARLCRDRFLANRGRMPGFANGSKVKLEPARTRTAEFRNNNIAIAWSRDHAEH
jgi:hypothetical protein